MKNINIILLLTAAFLGSACEQVVDNPELPYQEKLVIRGVLVAGEEPDLFQLSRTLPPLDEMDLEKVRLDGVDAFVSDGENRYDLVRETAILYKADGLIPETGKTYRIEVRWNGKYAWAETTIPDDPVVDGVFQRFHKVSGRYGWWEVKYYAAVKPNNDLYYFGSTLHTDSQGNVNGRRDFYKVYGYSDRDKNGFVNVLVAEESVDDTTTYNNSSHIFKSVIYSAGKEFNDYFQSRNYDGVESSDIFGTSGSNVTWNIRGDGIGMFVGMGEAIIDYEF